MKHETFLLCEVAGISLNQTLYGQFKFPGYSEVSSFQGLLYKFGTDESVLFIEVSFKDVLIERVYKY